MNDRIHRALDDELTRAELSKAESAELEESSALFATVLGSIPARPIPNLGNAVLDRIARLEPDLGPRGTKMRLGFVDWLLSPQRISIPLRPAYALGLAAILALVIGVRGMDDNPSAVPERPATAGTEPQKVLVHFRFEAPSARAVSLAGDFSNWAPSYSLTRSDPGVWTIVIPLEPGVHDYSFIVDGEKWVPDPTAPAMADGFGGMNSRIAVLAPDSRTSL